MTKRLQLIESKFRVALEKALSWAESVFISNYPFSADKSELTLLERIAVLLICFHNRLVAQNAVRREVTAFVYSQADKRMLIPVLLRMMQRADNDESIRVNLIIHSPLSTNDMHQNILKQLTSLGCNISTNKLNLIKACLQPHGKVVLLCLDQRGFYEHHKAGVDVADMLRSFGVKTVSIEHGGSREEMVTGLATSASDVVLVWGRRVLHELVEKHKLDRSKLRLVGNPLHDKLLRLERNQIIHTVESHYPEFKRKSFGKAIVVLATCIHYEYKDYENEQEMYWIFLQHIYDSLDFSRVCLFIKTHPEDPDNPLYAQLIPPHSTESVYIFDSRTPELDVYSLLHVADVLVTRASTVAEEALVMGKKVIAFDLITSGPSQYYKHLEPYGYYRTVYASPQNALREAISDALSSQSNHNYETVIEDFTYLLDGKSTDRAVDEVIDQVLQ